MDKINGESAVLEIIFPIKNTYKTNENIDLLKDVKVIGRGSEEAVLTYESTPPFDNTKEGTYVITYKAVSSIGTTITKTREISIIRDKYDYAYTGNYQEFIAPADGYYKFEAWGAGAIIGGGYTSGKMELKKNEKIYVYVGEKGQGCNPYTSCGASYNGGGAGGFFTMSGYQVRVLTGGGATDFRLVAGNWSDFDSLKSRIMVAAGSGGNNRTVSVSSGGGLLGLNGASGGRNGAYAGSGATQTSGGNGREKGKFGIGGTGYIGSPNSPNCNDAGGGGGGYYGGGSGYGAAAGCSPNADGTGGGGSSFISGHIGCNAINGNSTSTAINHTNQPKHYSNKVFTDTQMKAGNEVMPNYNGGTMTGNAGNGYARITYIGLENIDTYEEYISDLKLLHLDSKNHGDKPEIWKDVSNNYNDTILTNFSYTAASGWTENGLQFDGSDDYITLNSISGYSSNTSYTIEFVVSFPSYKYIEIDFGAVRFKWRVSGQIEYWNTINSSNTYLNSYNAFSSQGSLNTICHYAVTLDKSSNTLTFYKNGVKYTSAVSSYVSQNLKIISNSSEQFNGKIYSIRMYNKVLNEKEILNNFNADKIKYMS